MICLKVQASISKATIDRLPLYFRALRNAQEEGLDIISSDELGRRLSITPEQIRRDLTSLGQFGKKGVGYYVNELKKNVSNILGLDNHWNMAIVGVGHLGAALANYQNLGMLGFQLVALFDRKPEVIGTTVNHVQVEDMERVSEIVHERNIKIGVITVPAAFAQDVADRLISAGVKGIWNFAPAKMCVPDDVCIVNEDIFTGLSTLSYHMVHM